MGSNIVSIYNLFLTFIGMNGKLYTYVDSKEGEKWVEKFPPIGRPCIHSPCVSTEDKVLVFTGHGLEGHILDLRTLDWTHFELDRRFAYLYRLMFQFVHNGIMYQAAGLDLAGENTDFQSCPVSEVKSNKCIICHIIVRHKYALVGTSWDWEGVQTTREQLPQRSKGVPIHWTGLLDWTTGLDYWTGLLDSKFTHKILFPAHLKPPNAIVSPHLKQCPPLGHQDI